MTIGGDKMAKKTPQKKTHYRGKRDGGRGIIFYVKKEGTLKIIKDREKER